ncbi:MAG: hypothetical protein V1773_05915 [bacterium]
MNKKIKSVVTCREYVKHPSYHIVFEWEDVFKELLNVNFESKNILKQFYFNKFTGGLLSNLKTKKFAIKDELKILFLMNATYARYMFDKGSYLPIIIDFWKQDESFLTSFPKDTFFLINNLEGVNLLRSKGFTKCFYFPLSISDKYLNKTIPPKTIDVIQIGRKNQMLTNYMQKFLIENPNIEYLEQKFIDNKFYYVSSKSNKLFDANDRKKYMELVGKSKISLVSSPGCDSIDRTGGFDPLTPRFLESAIQYCSMLGRYSNNDDFNNLKISSVCENIKSYEQFEFSLSKRLKEDFEQKEVYDTFINNNLTSKRVAELKKLLEINSN